MAFVLDSTVGGADANAYGTRAEYIEIAEGHFEGELFTNLSNLQKDQYISRASLRLDAERYTALPTTLTQRLQFPRNFAFKRSYTSYGTNEIPYNLKLAVFELIIFWLKCSDRLLDEVELHDAAMMTDFSVGPLKMGFRANAKMDQLPETVKRELLAIGPNVWIGDASPRRIKL